MSTRRPITSGQSSRLQSARKASPASAFLMRTALIALAMMVPAFLAAFLVSPIFSSTHPNELLAILVAFGVGMAVVSLLVGTVEAGLLGTAAFLTLFLYLAADPWKMVPEYAISGLFMIAALVALFLSVRGHYLRSLRFALVASTIFALSWELGSAPPVWVMAMVLLGLVTPPLVLWSLTPTQDRKRAKQEARNKPNSFSTSSANNRNERDGKGIVSTVDAVIPRHDFQAVVGMIELKRRFADALFQIACGWEAGTVSQERKKGQAFKLRVDQLRERLGGVDKTDTLDEAPKINTSERVVIAGSERTTPVRNGILLYGEAGNGKTFMAEALAGELGLPFMCFSKGSIASKWIGQTTQQLLAVFAKAQEKAPVVLFIDELDGLLLDRDHIGSGYTEGRELVNTFLVEIERLRQSQVIVLGATNHLEAVDSAAIRDGRFDFKIEVPPPDEAARRALLHQIGRFRGAPCVLSKDTEKLLLKRWEGYSATRVLAITRETAELVCSRPPDDSGSVPLGIDDFKRALSNIQGTRGARLPEDAPRLDQVILNQTTQDDLASLLWRISHPEETAKAGGSLPTGILFYGPPGTGKTMTAKALAKESRWSFLTTSGLDLMSAADSVKNLMKEAREARPALIYIDEADNILASRGGGRASPVLNELLAVMDGAGGRLNEVIFVAATNCPENIDPAALRGGRFTEKFHFQLPDQAMLTRYLCGWMSRTRAKVSLNIEVMAAILAGESLANVEAILAAAINHALSRQNGDGLTPDDLIHARARVRYN